MPGILVWSVSCQIEGFEDEEDGEDEGSTLKIVGKCRYHFQDVLCKWSYNSQFPINIHYAPVA